MRADIAVLQQGARNAQDGISLLQTMEGAMQTIDDALVRMKQLAQQAVTGTYSSAQRVIMNNEFAEMAEEIERIATTTRFNDTTYLDSANSVTIQVGDSDNTITVTGVDMTKAGLGINTGVQVDEAIFTPELANTDSDTFVTIGDETVTLSIQFDNAGTTEDAITIDLTAGTYTIAQVEAAINAQSQALGYAPDGTDKSYDMASVVTNTDGTYSLKVSSRDEADNVTIQVSSTGTTGDWDLAGTTDTVTTDAPGAGVAINADNYSESQVTGGVNILTTTAANSAMDAVTAAIITKDTARAAFGYKMNRLEYTVGVTNIQSENIMAAESRISDVDVATEMAILTRTQVLAQAGVAMLAQANAMPQMALTLLR
jgi:flagellin